MSAHLEITDDIAVLNLGDDENRFSLEWLAGVNGFLDRIESGEAKALVTTGSGKFYSNGLDLDWLAAHSDQGDWYVDQVHQLLARVLVAPVPTVAAINGHAFGAGSMLGIAHDFRVMRVDRGYRRPRDPIEGQGSRHPARDQVDHVRERDRRTEREGLSHSAQWARARSTTDRRCGVADGGRQDRRDADPRRR
jgi:hypothetical protein